MTEKDDKHRTVSVALFHARNVCLVQPRKQDFKALPGGHVKKGESFIDAALRELDEETGVSLKRKDLIYVGHVQRNKKKVDVIFAARLDKEKKVRPGGDVTEAEWTPLKSLPEVGWNHRRVIRQAVKLFKTDPKDRGMLVVFEGVDGSGKSTQVERLNEWLEENGYVSTWTKWNSSPVVKAAISKAKSRRELDPLLYSLLHSADMVHRYEHLILPALERNLLVISDRYWFTSVVRDQVRGVKRDLNNLVYEKFRKPDVIFYCRVKPEIAVARLSKDGRLTHYGSGMDVATKEMSPEESCLLYTKKMARFYDSILPKKAVQLDMTLAPSKVFDIVKAHLEDKLAQSQTQLVEDVCMDVNAKIDNTDLTEREELVENLSDTLLKKLLSEEAPKTKDGEEV